MIDNISGSSDDPYCLDCWGQRMELETWVWEVERQRDDFDSDFPMILNVRFVWKCKECGGELTKYTTVGHLV